MSFFRWWLTVGCDSPSGSISSHTQTGSSLRASRLTSRTRAGSPRALNSAAVASASVALRRGAESGRQHWASITFIDMRR